MGCILRAGGKNFDVEAFIEKGSLVVDSLWLKGAKRFPNSISNETVNESSGIRVVASEADFSELALQIEDAITFLRNNLASVKTLTAFPGVEGAVLDFGAEISPPGWASLTFPPELLLLAGSAGVSVSISVYPTESKHDTDA